MKRFKKLTIYILVGMLVSSSVMISYKRADEVKASATLTLSAGALAMLGILAAYGIVYKGNIDSTLEQYIWKGDRGLYPHEVEEAEEWWTQMWDNTVRQHASNNGYDPDNWNDEDNDLETQPPLWEKVVGTLEKKNNILKLGATVFGAIASKLAYGVYQESLKPREGNYISGTGTLKSSFRRIGKSYDVTHYTNCVVTQGANVKSVLVRYTYSNSLYIKQLFYSTSPFKCYFRNEAFPDSTYLETASSTSNGYYYIDRTISISESDNILECVPSLIDTDLNLGYNSIVADFIAELELDENMVWNESGMLINQENIGHGSDIDVNDEQEQLNPISPLITIPTASMINKLLDDLENSYGNDDDTQQAVDDFIADLEYTDPEPDPEPNPNPTPDPNPDSGVDSGESGGEGETEHDKDNLLADLKHVFPFCIPFDLIDCFRLFNAEPETPRVEIPLHFKLNGFNGEPVLNVKYDFVIDLKDFDGVAQVCRSMFLVLFITGLVLSTRSLIRG